ncbi:MAG: hypothetical protein H6622_13905 [Halobacteriovoraceae bacterium]|nr:hypothetical protein [Halobacteriovoraceae bacterium]
MGILSKHKKNGEVGLKKFVKNLETTPYDKFKDIMQRGILEDPMYMVWIYHNLISFRFLFKLNESDFDKVVEALPNSVQTCAFAFFQTHYESDFLNQASEKIKREWKEFTENININIAQMRTARTKILETIRKLQDDAVITPFNWHIPPKEILNGDSMSSLPKEGIVTMYYQETKTLALQGEMRSKQRHGIWKHYYPTGNLMVEGLYELGEKVGPWVFYYGNGGKLAEGDYSENLKQGTWMEYDREGHAQQVSYERGKKAA